MSLFKNKKEIDSDRKLITNLDPKSYISEQYRTIRTSIEFKMSDQGLKTFIITSPEAGAGKSTTSANLAVSFAQQGKKVLLIDADLRKPTVQRSFRLPNHKGLTNLLTQSLPLEEVLQTTEISETLKLISSGPVPPNPSELLGSAAMKKLLEAVEEQFDTILIDTPPVNVVTDAHILSRMTDGTIIVAFSGQTKKEDLIKIKKSFEKINANLIGVVLHGLDTKESAYYYYYGAE